MKYMNYLLYYGSVWLLGVGVAQQSEMLVILGLGMLAHAVFKILNESN